MGLMDVLNPEARAGLMMMAAAGPSAQPMNFGQRMAGLLATMDAQKAAEEDRKMRQQQMALQQRHLQAQIDETQAQAQQRAAAAQAAERQAQEQQRIRGLVSSAFAPVSPVQANAASGVTGPRPQALDVVGTRPQVDYQGLIAQGVPPELVQKLAESRNYGRDEVARTVEVMGPNGPETVQVDKFGNRVGQGFAKPFELKMQDLGGQVVALNPFTGARQGGGLAKTQTPESIASNAVAWANHGLSKQRFAYDQGKDARDAAAKAAEPKPLTDAQSKALLFGSRMQSSDKLLADLATAGTTTSTPGSNAGYGIGAALNVFSSANQQQLNQAKRDFINATLRRESGAVISEQEFDNAEKQYFPQIGDSKEVIAQKARNRQIATRGVLAEVPSGHQPKVAEVIGGQGGIPAAGTIENGYRFKGGNPADPKSWEKV